MAAIGIRRTQRAAIRVKLASQGAPYPVLEIQKGDAGRRTQARLFYGYLSFRDPDFAGSMARKLRSGFLRVVDKPGVK